MSNTNTMNAATFANIAAQTAIEFLAAKHGVTREAITAAINAKNEKVCTQFIDLITAAIVAG